MSSSFLKFAGLTLFVLMAGAVPARADSLIVQVPFDFIVNGHQLPAGDYRVDRREPSSVVLIRNQRDPKEAFFVQTMQGDEVLRPPVEPYLTFGKYENSYRLESLWTEESGQRDLLKVHASPHRTATVTLAGRPVS